MDYLLLKWIHIISATVLFGTGVGSAFFMFMANRRKNVPDIYFAARHVVIADWIFTTPAVVLQLLTGVALTYSGGFGWNTLWIKGALAVYVFAGACWLPVVWMQIRMRDMAKTALASGAALPPHYWLFDRWWIILGSLAFPAVAIIFWLMVAKP